MIFKNTVKSGKQGSISIFFALTFFLILALLFSMLEVSRVYALRANAFQKSELAILSAYSNYGQQIAEEFGLLFLWENGEELEDYLYLYGKNQLGESNSLLRLALTDVTVEDKTYATDEGGISFLNQVAEVTPYRVGGEAIEELLDIGNLNAQMEVVTNFTELLEQGQDTLEGVAEVLETVKSGVSTLKNMTKSVENVYSSFENLTDDISSFFNMVTELGALGREEEETSADNEDEDGEEKKQATEETEETKTAEENEEGTGAEDTQDGNGTGQNEESEEKDESIQKLETEWLNITETFEEGKNQIAATLTEVQTQVSAVISAMEQFETVQKDAAALADSLESTLNSWKNHLSTAVYNGLKSQIDEIRDVFTITEDDSYGRRKLKSSLESLESKLQSMINHLDQLEIPSFDELWKTIKDQAEEEAKSYFDEFVTRITEEFVSEGTSLVETVSKLSFTEISYNSASSSGDNGLSQGLLETILGLMENGVLSLVIDDVNSISANTIETADLPSTTSVSTGSEQTTFLKSQWNRLLMACYCGLYFYNYLDPSSDLGLKYEVEYVLGGGKSDKSNLESVMGSIFLIREGINYAYLLTDSAKMQEAGAAALAIASAVGLPILKIPVQMLLLAAWAAGESIYDLRKLYSGESLPLYKTKKTWNLSLSHLADIASAGIASGAGVENTNSDSLLNFDYCTYLIILLMIQNGKTQTYRMMDVIQNRIKLNVNDEFLMNHCLAEAAGSMEYEGACLFTGTWVTRQLAKAPETYRITTPFSYGYAGP